MSEEEVSVMKVAEDEESGVGGPTLRTLAIIPCYNEEKTVASVILKARQSVTDVVVIDDGSDDETGDIAKLAGATVIRHEENRGYGGAIQSCFSYAKKHDYDCMTILDGDGQHDADQVRSVMDPVLNGETDICIGSRFLTKEQRDKVPRYRQMGIGVLTSVTNMFSPHQQDVDAVKLTDAQSGFRAYGREAISALSPCDANMGVSAEIVLQARKHQLDFLEVPIDCSYEGDTSTQSPVKHGVGVLISILQYLEVEHSLLVFGVPGFVFVVTGMILGLYCYFEYTASGFFVFAPTALAGLLFITGLFLGMTGLILHAVLNANRRR